MDLLREKMRLLPMSGPQDLGGGGGGGGSSNTTSTQTQMVDLPDWAKGYAQDVLSKGAALTDIGQNPYQAYTQPRIADLSSLQKTAMGTVASPEAFGQTVQGYMSPYMQNVVDVQKRAAREQAGIQAGGLNARAAQAGAFGGSGIALQRAAGQRDLSRQLDEIQKMGSQAAFQQGVQQANTAVQQQTQLGALQQQQAQRPLDMAYQDFLTQKNYPYQQLSYMANLVRGTPMGMNTQSQVYQPGPSAIQNIGSLGLGAYGLKSLFGAKGGLMESYADGGSVADKFHDPEAMMADMSKLTDQQLQQILQAPTTPAEAEAAQRELAIRASERRGLAGAFNQVPYDAQQRMVRAAGGGILAFADGGINKKALLEQSLEDQPEVTPEDWTTGVTARAEGLSKLYGPDTLAPYMEELKQERAQYRGGISDTDKGLIALQAAGALVDPRAGGNLFRGLGLAASTAGRAAADINAQNKQANRELLRSQIEMARAQQARKEGQVNMAAKLEDAAATRKAAAFEQKRDAASKAAEILSREETTKAQIAAQNRPGETERMLAQIESIRSGKSSFAGKTGEEGAAAFTAALGDVGAARYGVRYTGDKDVERITNILKGDEEYKSLKTQRSQLGIKGDLNAKQKARLERIDTRLGELEAAARQRANKAQAAPTSGASADGGPKSYAQWLRAAKAANPDASDDDLKAYYDRKYGGE